MSDSTLSRRSAALRTKLPTGNGEMPENFKYVWLDLSALQAVEAYKDLSEIERSFRELKDLVEMQRIVRIFAREESCPS